MQFKVQILAGAPIPHCIGEPVFFDTLAQAKMFGDGKVFHLAAVADDGETPLCDELANAFLTTGHDGSQLNAELAQAFIKASKET